MKLVAVDKVPDRVKKNHKLQKLIEEFAHSDAEVCKVGLDEGEYKNIKSACGAMRIAVKRSKRPIKVFEREGEMYLAK